MIKNALVCIGLTLCLPIFVHAASGNSTAQINCNNCPNLHHAIDEGHTGCVERLITAGANIEEIVDGQTPLFAAAFAQSKNNNASIIMQLLIDHGANVNIEALGGCTPLWLCGKWSQKKGAEVLLRAGAETQYTTKNGTPTDISNYSVIPELLAQPDVRQAWERARQNHATKSRCVKTTPLALIVSVLGTWSVIYTIKQEYKKARKEIITENQVNNITMTDKELSNAILERTWQNIHDKPWSQKKTLIAGITAMVGGAGTALICWLK